MGAIPRTLSFEETVRRLAAGLAEALVPRDAGAASRVADRFLADAHRHLRRNQELLERLRARYRLGVVSNFYGNLETTAPSTSPRRPASTPARAAARARTWSATARQAAWTAPPVT